MLGPYTFSSRLVSSGMESEEAADEYLLILEEPPTKVRIETQIHRRRTVKAFSPLTLEWEQARPARLAQRTTQNGCK